MRETKNRDKFGRFKKGNQSRLGKTLSVKAKQQISDKLTGRKLSKKVRKNMSNAQKKRIPNSKESYQKGIDNRRNSGKPWFSKEHKRKLSDAKQGEKNPNFGKTFSKERVRKMLMRNPKSSLEIEFEQIITKLNLPYKFVGNGEVIIGRKCPDFINTNGEKIAIEVFYRKHKEMFRDGLEKWKQEREKLFKEYGWTLLFFNEIEVNESNIKEKLGVEKR